MELYKDVSIILSYKGEELLCIKEASCLTDTQVLSIVAPLCEYTSRCLVFDMVNNALILGRGTAVSVDLYQYELVINHRDS